MKYLVMLALFATQTVQEMPSIVESARRNGGKSTVNISVMSPLETVDGIAQESSVIVRGVVTAVGTKLSNDQSIVVTEFEVAPEKFYKGAIGFAKRPGQVDPIVIQRPGGILHLDGLELQTVINEFPAAESSFNSGEQLVLFLAPNALTPGKFRIAGGAYGAFRVERGNVVALTKRAAARRGDRAMSLASFEANLEALLRH